MTQTTLVQQRRSEHRTTAAAAAESLCALGRLLLDLGEVEAAREPLERARKLAAGAAALPSRGQLQFDICMASAEQLRRAGDPRAAFDVLCLISSAHEAPYMMTPDDRAILLPVCEMSLALMAAGDLEMAGTFIRKLRLQPPRNRSQQQSESDGGILEGGVMRAAASGQPPRPPTMAIVKAHLIDSLISAETGRLSDAEVQLRSIVEWLVEDAACAAQRLPAKMSAVKGALVVNDENPRWRPLDPWELELLCADALHYLACVLEARLAAAKEGEAAAGGDDGGALGGDHPSSSSSASSKRPRLEEEKPPSVPREQGGAQLLEKAERLYSDALRIREEMLSGDHCKTRETRERLEQCRERRRALAQGSGADRKSVV